MQKIKEMIGMELLFILTLGSVSLIALFLTKSVVVALALLVVAPIGYKYKNHSFLLFVAFSYFRFQEAFPFLLPVIKP